MSSEKCFQFSTKESQVDTPEAQQMELMFSLPESSLESPQKDLIPPLSARVKKRVEELNKILCNALEGVDSDEF